MTLRAINTQTREEVSFEDHNEFVRALRAGEVVAPRGSRVPVIGPQGYGTIDVDELASTLSTDGWRIATQEEAHEERDRERYEGLSGVIRTVAEGYQAGGSGYATDLAEAPGGETGRVLGTAAATLTNPTLGTATALADVGESAEERRHGIAERAERNPIARTVGEVGGIMASLLNPVSAASLVTRGAGAFATRAGGGALRQAVTREVIEGVATSIAEEGGAMAVSEEDIDPAQAAERLAVAAGVGVAFGGAAGAATRGAGVLASAVGRRVRGTVDDMAEALRTHYSRTLADPIEPEAARVVAREIAPHEIYGTGERAEQAYRVWTRADDTIDQATLTVTDSISAVESGTDAVRTALQSPHKGVNVERVILPGAIEAQIENSRQALSSIRQITYAAERGDLGIFTDATKGRMRALASVADAMEHRIKSAEGRILNDASSRKLGADLYMSMDQAKRSIGHMAFREYHGAPRVREAYESLRSALENDKVYGAELAELQGRVNAAAHSYFVASSKLGGSIRSVAGRSPDDAFRVLREGNTSGVHGMLRRIGVEVKGATERSNFVEYLQAAKKYTETVDELYELPADISSRIRSVAIDDALAGVDEVMKNVRLGNQIKHMMERQEILFDLAGGAMGGAVGGLPGMAIGALMSSPRRAARAMALVRRVKNDTDGKMAAAVRGFFRGTKEAAVSTGRGAKRFARTAASGQVTASAFNDAVQRVLTAANDPKGMSERLSAHASDLVGGAPNTAVQYGQAAARGVQYMRSIIPPGAIVSDPLFPDRNMPGVVSDSEMAAFFRALRVVEDPFALLDAFQRGHITPEEVDALAAVYPTVYRDLVQEVSRQAREADVTYQQRITLGILLRAPTDPTLEPQFISAMQATWAQKAQRDAELAEQAQADLSQMQQLDTSGAHQSEVQRISARQE